MHEGHRERLRQKFLNADKDKLSNFEPHEILELLLFYVMPRVNTNEVAHRLIDKFGSLSAVFDADVDSLQQVDGIGKQSAVFLSLISATFGEYAKSKSDIKNAVLTSDNVGKYVISLFFGQIYEVFYLISLDAQNRVITTDRICHGSIDSVEVNLRNIVSTVLRSNATSVILAHNHPGGHPLPSDADKHLTKMISQLLKAINVQVIDHIIVSDNEYTSMAFDLHLL